MGWQIWGPPEELHDGLKLQWYRHKEWFWHWRWDGDVDEFGNWHRDGLWSQVWQWRWNGWLAVYSWEVYHWD